MQHDICVIDLKICISLYVDQCQGPFMGYRDKTCYTLLEIDKRQSGLAGLLPGDTFA